VSKEEYIDKANGFVFDRLKCLRNEYAHNNCTNCLDICPTNALVIERKKLRLAEQNCINCGICIGFCPTNALSLLENDTNYALKKLSNQDNPMLTCENLGACLSKFNSVDFTTIALEFGKSFTCNLFTCKGCEFNKNKTVQNFIENAIDEANTLLEKVQGIKIEKNYDVIALKTTRRELFKSLFIPAGKEISSVVFESRVDRLKFDLKPYVQELQDTLLKEDMSFVYKKEIDHSCTNCGDCINFCPTSALSYNSDKSKIYFQMGKCIGCHICEDICKPNSIMKSQDNSFDLVDFVYNRATVLIEHQIKICKLCKCGFSYKGGEVICDRCATFETENSDIFTLACDT
jgi:ferredoxin